MKWDVLKEGTMSRKDQDAFLVGVSKKAGREADYCATLVARSKNRRALGYSTIASMLSIRTGDLLHVAVVIDLNMHRVRIARSAMFRPMRYILGPYMGGSAGCVSMYIMNSYATGFGTEALRVGAQYSTRKLSEITRVYTVGYDTELTPVNLSIPMFSSDR